ncbi:MAG TPA: hypothetical protein VHA06_19530 [Candidatus Angelobacter sp.]|jgi:hypothetical protein|nr:hypothetical protein [Candidatus Angelobacter sp.]
MATKKEANENSAPDRSGDNSGKHMSESSPNPHGESKVLKMPINTDQRNATGGRNIPQVPNTVGGKLNPGVVHEFKSRVLTKEAKTDKVKIAQSPRREKNTSILGNKKKDA